MKKYIYVYIDETHIPADKEYPALLLLGAFILDQPLSTQFKQYNAFRWVSDAVS